MVGGGEYSDFPQTGGADFDAELFVRYAQASALFPMLQFSAAPWRLLDDEGLNACRNAAALHCQLAPEILELATQAARTGEPILRHLSYVYPREGYDHVHDQFLLGDDILVAPVLEPNAHSRIVCFPPGCWVGDDGEQVVGPCRHEVQAPLTRLPWFRKVV